MIEEKAGRFYVRVVARGRRVSLGACATRSEAENLERAGYLDAEESPHMTVGAWGKDWLERREKVEKVRHIKSDLRAWKKHVTGSPIATAPLALLDAEQLDAWVRRVRKATTPAGKPLAPKTVREIVLLMKQCLDAAVPKHLGGNPLPAVMRDHRAALRREQDARNAVADPWTSLSGPEQRALLTSKKIPEAHRLIMASAILTGMRQGEQFNLELGDVHVEGDEPHLVVRWGGKDKPPKNGKPRTVWLSQKALAVVRRWLAILPTWTTGANMKSARQLMFPLKTGGRVAEGKTPLMSSTRVEGKPVRRNLFDDYLALVGIERHVRWHDLRHTCASSLISGTWGRRWTLEEVRAFMGHRSRQSTDRYAHLAEDALKSAVWGAPNSARRRAERPSKSSQQSRRSAGNRLAPAAGLEPATRRLTAACSTD